MTNRILTTLILRISGVFLFIKIFDYFGSYFLSLYSTAALIITREEGGEELNNFFFKGTFLIIANIIISLFLFLKAEWISKYLIKTDKEIVTELNPKSLSKVILMTVGIVWLATSVYLLPEFIGYVVSTASKLNGIETVGSNIREIQAAKYILRTLIAFILIFRIEKVSNWITKRL